MAATKGWDKPVEPYIQISLEVPGTVQDAWVTLMKRRPQELPDGGRVCVAGC